MSKKWEISRVSTSERIFDKIKMEMAQPVSIVLFGADCEFKSSVLRELQDGMHDVKVFHGAPSTHEMVELIHCSPVSVFVLSSMESSDHQLRHECVKIMRTVGAKTVVGIYAKVKGLPSLSARGFMAKSESELIRDTVRRLKRNPPTADGLDYLLVVSEENEE